MLTRTPHTRRDTGGAGARAAALTSAVASGSGLAQRPRPNSDADTTVALLRTDANNDVTRAGLVRASVAARRVACCRHATPHAGARPVLGHMTVVRTDRARRPPGTLKPTSPLEEVAICQHANTTPPVTRGPCENAISVASGVTAGQPAPVTSRLHSAVAHSTADCERRASHHLSSMHLPSSDSIAFIPARCRRASAEAVELGWRHLRVLLL